MKKHQKIYTSIDLKSFYASVECMARGLNPLTTNLVVADSSRTQKTICLAVSPSLKAYGISGRARLFEVVKRIKQVNAERYKRLTKGFSGKSYNDIELKKDNSLEVDYIIAPPRMNLYMKYSGDIYNIYLKYFSQDDIFPYSIDEVFCDLTPYLETYKMTPKELVTKVITDVHKQTGITATAGIGSNMYLCKVAMDIVAKHTEPDRNGVRIAELDEMSYRKNLWEHKPLTDFWRVGSGYAKRLQASGIFTMGDVARISINNEDLLYKLFGINAELLIDHAWGYEPTTIKDVKNYKPDNKCISSGQVLHCPYNYEKTRLIVKEMAELLTLDLVEKNLVTNQIVLTIGYDVDNLTIPEIRKIYNGEITIDRYGRKVPKHAHGTINLEQRTSSTRKIMEATISLYERIINKDLLVRRINITANKLVNENINSKKSCEQLNLFENLEESVKQRAKEQAEKNLQKALLGIKNKYGKNAILKGMNFEDGGTTIERNGQIGGHKG